MKEEVANSSRTDENEMNILSCGGDYPLITLLLTALKVHSCLECNGIILPFALIFIKVLIFLLNKVSFILLYVTVNNFVVWIQEL